MEECDALASRIGIMADGRLVCVGSSQHLKSRFASGYSVQIKPRDGRGSEARSRFMLDFPHATVVDIFLVVGCCVVLCCALLPYSNGSTINRACSARSVCAGAQFSDADP